MYINVKHFLTTHTSNHLCIIVAANAQFYVGSTETQQDVSVPNGAGKMATEDGESRSFVIN